MTAGEACTVIVGPAQVCKGKALDVGVVCVCGGGELILVSLVPRLRKTETERERRTGRQTDRQTEERAQRQRSRERERETEKGGGGFTWAMLSIFASTDSIEGSASVDQSVL